MDVRNLGVFANIESVWSAYPEGGYEGDYLFIGGSEEDGTKYRWNKYERIWENAATVTESTARRTETFDGDVNIQNNLTVAGTLRAKRINFEKLDFDETPTEGSENGITSGGVANALNQVYKKTETYSKEELDSLITTPDVQYVSVSSYAELPETGEADTIYRVGNWDGSQVATDVYCEYAWDGNAYVHLSTKTNIGEVFDISAYHATGGELAKYADLAAALGINGANIPQSLHKGGMSVKFVQSSDNKYMQARCMAQSFTTDTTQWQGVDNEPTAGSENLVKSGGVHNFANLINNYPFENGISKSEYDDCIVDFFCPNNISYEIGLHTLSKTDATHYLIRLCALDSQGAIDTSKGANGIVAIFDGEIGSGLQKLEDKYHLIGDFNMYCVVDFNKFPTDTNNHANRTLPRIISRNLTYKADELSGNKSVYNLTPVANETVWRNKTYFPDLAWMKDFVVSLKLMCPSSYDKSYPICIGQMRVLNGGRTFLTIHKCSESGAAPYDGASQICLFDNKNWSAPVLDSGGHRYQTLALVQKNNSGVYGSMVVDWSVLPIDYATQSTKEEYNNYNVLNALLSSKVFSEGEEVSGAALINFTVDGVDAVLQTSSLYTPDGTPDWLMIVSHGNGQGDNLTAALPSAKTGNLDWFKAHGISMAVIRTQDEEVAPYTTNATGWGNSVCIARTIKLYNYLMEHYNFKRTVILAGMSMGGLTMGTLAYKKPFPIAFCLGCGPVPGVKIMFQNSSSAYKESIRAAYGMSADGSDDANIESFVKGYDWYDMGLIEINGIKKKIGFGNVYMYYGNDNTFRTKFGGTAQYAEIVNALLSVGSYSKMAQAGVTDKDGHATDKCFAEAISDGVFLREIGIVTMT